MRDWSKAPPGVHAVLAGIPALLIPEALATTVLSHDDGCRCELCTWWHTDGGSDG